MVSGPGLRQSPGGATRLAGGRLPPDDRFDRQGDRVHQGRKGDRAGQAVLHVLLPRRHARPAPRPAGVDREVRGHVRHGLRAVPRTRVRPAEADEYLPGARGADPAQPVHGRAERRQKPWPPLDVVRPWDSLSDDEKRLFAGWPRSTRVPQPHRPRDRATAQLPRAVRSGREHDHRPGLGQRCQRRGRAQRLGQREQVLQRHSGRHGGEHPSTSSHSGSPATYNHYPAGWAWAFNTPFKMWKRYNFEGGVADPLVISWPAGIKAKGRASPPVPARH